KRKDLVALVIFCLRNAAGQTGGQRPPLQEFLDQALRLLRGHAEFAKREWSFAGVQHWLRSFQAFQVGPAPKQSNWNFFAPLITALDRLVQIGRVVALFLENFDPGIEPLVSVVFVV